MGPKLKETIQFFPMAGGLFHVYDASTGRHFKLGTQEVGWLKMLDGTRSHEQFVGRIPHEYFADFFRLIGQMGLIDGVKPARKIPLLKIKLFKVDPAPLLKSLAGFGSAYNEFLDIYSIPLFLINLFLGIVAWQVGQDAINGFRLGPEVILYYIGTILITATAHEMSHAMVAHSLGVRVPSIGMMLFFLHPALFADVSGIMFLPERRDRIKVLLAGIKANNWLLTIGLFGFLCFRGTPAGSAMLVFTSANLMLILLNSIPFVEYDGYFVFRELVGDSNFATNAVRQVVTAANARMDYVAYFIAAALFRVALVDLGLLTVHRAIKTLWVSDWLNYGFIALIALTTPFMIFRMIRRPG